MQLIPKQKHTYRSKHAPDAIAALIDELIDPEPKVMTIKYGKPQGKPYYGSWSSDDRSFSIVRKINHRNSFLPRIKGTIEPDGSGSVVHVTMRMPLLVRGFIAFWLSGVSFGLITVVGHSIREGSWGWWVLAPIGMILFMLMIVNFGFRTEAAKSKKHLAQLFETAAEA